MPGPPQVCCGERVDGAPGGRVGGSAHGAARRGVAPLKHDQPKGVGERIGGRLLRGRQCGRRADELDQRREVGVEPAGAGEVVQKALVDA